MTENIRAVFRDPFFNRVTCNPRPRRVFQPSSPNPADETEVRRPTQRRSHRTSLRMSQIRVQVSQLSL